MTSPQAPHGRQHHHAQTPPHQAGAAPNAQPGTSPQGVPSNGVPPGAPVAPGSPQEERLLAAASYLTWMAGFWVVGPIAIFLVYKDKSRFVAFHAVQSIVVSVGLTVLMPMVWLLNLVVSFFVAYAVGKSYAAGVVLLAIHGGWAVMVLVPFVCMVVGAWRAYHGVWWRIPLAWRVTERFLANDQPNQDAAAS